MLKKGESWSVLCLAFLYWLFMFLLNKTYRFKVIGGEHVEKIRQKEGNAIFAFWHRSTFPLFYIYHILFPQGRGSVFTTTRWRGQIISYITRRFALSPIPVPTTVDFTGGAKGALQMLRALKEDQDSIIAADGPQGPLYKLKPGIIYLAQKGERPILPVAVAASTKLTLKFRWDKYFIPLPFSKVIIAFGEPFRMPLEMRLKGIHKKCTELEEILHSLTKQAEAEASSI